MNTPTVSPSPSRVFYNRSGKKWEAHNGRLLGIFPAGDAGKQQAQLCGLKHDNRALWEEVEWIRQAHVLDAQGDAISSRAIKAALLVEDEAVIGPPAWSRPDDYVEDRIVARVKSATKTYFIRPSIHLDGHLQCDCDDFFYRAPVLRSGQRACKHILAYSLATTLEQRNYEVEEWEAKLETAARWVQPRRPEAKRNALRRYAVEMGLT